MTGTPRENIVAAIEAAKNGSAKAWTDTNLTEWAISSGSKAEGSQPPTLREVTGHLLGELQLSMMLDKVMSTALNTDGSTTKREFFDWLRLIGLDRWLTNP